jgi:hypothetical protein
LKGGNVLHELPTRTPPTIQGKHQMKKKKKTTFSDRNGTFFHLSISSPVFYEQKQCATAI